MRDSPSLKSLLHFATLREICLAMIRDKLDETLRSVTYSATTSATCHAMILDIAGYVTLRNVSSNLPRNVVAKIATLKGVSLWDDPKKDQ